MISPDTLLSQVRNTVPFLWDLPETGFSQILFRAPTPPAGPAEERFGSFEFSLAAHYATVASFVPTDVDNAIRRKLWDNTNARDREALPQMAQLVLKARAWETRGVSTRWILSPKSGTLLAGHAGEWFSVAAAAYYSTKRSYPEIAREIGDAIESAVDEHVRVWKELSAAGDGRGLVVAAPLVAHNLGDLDRVIDLWVPAEREPEGPEDIKARVYKLGHLKHKRWGDALVVAGELNKQLTAVENHRHFALRGPRALRRSADFLLPIGPFFDAWGSRLARHPLISETELAEIVEALVEGQTRLVGTVGYARALAGIVEGFAGGLSRLSRNLSSKTAKALSGGGTIRTQLDLPRERFEGQWAARALKLAGKK